MKVLDLFCEREHSFEGWFGSEEDYQSQLQRGLVQCPLCGSSQVRKGLSAPRLNLGAQPATDTSARPDAMAVAPLQKPSVSGDSVLPSQPMQAAWLHMAREIVARTEDVGSRFADEAMRMHHGETAERPIRGQATREQTLQLLEEGVPVLPLVLPVAVKETLQ